MKDSIKYIGCDDPEMKLFESQYVTPEGMCYNSYIILDDLCREDMAEIIEDAFRMNRLIVCASSYDGNVFPPMHYFLWKLGIKGYQDRTVGIVENGTWAPSAGKAMRALVEPLKNVNIVEPMVTIRSTMKETDIPSLEALADAVLSAEINNS